ncbi:WxL protein peptidoglycan domain-containing protein [Microbacterium sp.]|uniref:WxL protein peptidoglycan domain-containing protein n=1 Tax=Microbacterium sp. TaxID=51671 RepID=UPI0037CA691F
MTALPRLPRVAVGALLAFALAAAAPPAFAEDGGVAWSVQTADNANGTGRANFSYDVDPGAVLADTMLVVNTGTEPLPLTVYAADAFTAASGEIDVLADGTPSQDAGTWVSVGQTSMELAPGQSAEVPFTITVPTDARPGDHSAGIVTSLASRDATSSLSVERRLGTRINLRVSGALAPAAAITGTTVRYDGSWNPFESGRLTVEYSLENVGNTRLTGVETVATSGAAGLLGDTTAPTQLPEIVTGSTIQVTREVPAFSLGWLSGHVTVVPEGVGLGAGTVAPVTADFSIAAVPWSLYGLIVLVIAAVVTVVLLARRRGAREASEADLRQAD